MLQTIDLILKWPKFKGLKRRAIDESRLLKDSRLDYRK